MSNTEKLLRSIIIIGIFALPFTCLYVSRMSLYPYVMGKNFAFRMIVEIISCAWLVLALARERYRPCSSKILGAFAVFVAVVAIANALGANPSRSFWSNYERMDGFITLAHVFLYTVIAATVLETKKLWQRLFQTTLGLSMLLSILGVLGGVGIVNLGSQALGLSGRIDATFGSPIYFAVYLLFHLFIAALLWAQSMQTRNTSKPLLPSLGYGAVIFCDTLALLLTGTRGTMLGLISGGLLALTLYAISHGAPKKLRNLTAITLILTLLASGAIHLARDTTFVHRVGFLQRLSTLSTQDNGTKARVINWQIAWQGVKEHPILGWGQENYELVFNKYYNPQMYAQEPSFDHVHNILFDWWVASGTLGLLCYLFLFALLFRVLWNPRVYTALERSILTGLLFGYFVHNLFIFDTVTSYILLGTVIGYMVWREKEIDSPKPILRGTFFPHRLLPFMATGALLCAGSLVYVINIPALRENQALLRAIITQSNPMESLAHYKKAISYGSYGTQEVRENLLDFTTKIYSAPNIPLTTKQALLNAAIDEMVRQERLAPLNARFPLLIGMAMDRFGDYAHAAMALQRAHELAPKKQWILFECAFNAKARGETAKTLQYLKQAYELAPEFLQARLFYATEAIIAGKDTLADALLAPIVSSGEAATNPIAIAYGQRQQFKKIIPIWRAHLQAKPQDAQGYITLAAAYYSSHNSQKAIATLQSLAQNVPNTAQQAQVFINQIQNAQ